MHPHKHLLLTLRASKKAPNMYFMKNLNLLGDYHRRRMRRPDPHYEHGESERHAVERNER